MATRRRIQLELPKLDASEPQFRSALNDRMRRIQSMFDELDFPPAIATVINTITQGTGLCVIQEIPEGAVDGTNRTFYLSQQPNPPLVWLLAGGLSMYPFGDYELTASEGKIVYEAGAQPKEGEEHWVWYFCGDAIQPPALSLQARLFAGGLESIDYGNNNSLYAIKGDVSIGIWLKFDSNTENNGVLAQYGKNIHNLDENHPYALQVVGSSNAWTIRYFHENGSVNPNQQFIDFAPVIGNGVWRYFGISRVVSTKTVTLYVGDGESILSSSSDTYTSDPDGGTSTENRLTFGNIYPGPGSIAAAYVGTMQEHYIWNAALSEEEHRAAMLGDPPAGGLVLSVGPSLGDNPEIDDSGNGATGAVTGTALVAGHP